MSDTNNTSTQDPSLQTLTIPLALFRKDFYSNIALANGGSEGAPLPISMQSAWLIHIADRTNEIFKVEFPTNPRPDSQALLWLISDYRQSMTRRRELKCESEMYRQRSYVYEENLGNLIYRIAKLTGLKRTDECIITTAQQVCNKNDPIAFASFGCKFVPFDEVAFKEKWFKEHPEI